MDGWSFWSHLRRKKHNRLIIIVIKNQCPFCGKSLRVVPINSEEYCPHCGCKIEQEHKKIQVWRSNGYENQGKGYGKALIDFLASKYADEYSVLQVVTGDSPLTIPFYEKCGFVRPHNIPNFFTDNYDHPIYECGVQLIDMVYLQRCL